MSAPPNRAPDKKPPYELHMVAPGKTLACAKAPLDTFMVPVMFLAICFIAHWHEALP